MTEIQSIIQLANKIEESNSSGIETENSIGAFPATGDLLSVIFIILIALCLISIPIIMHCINKNKVLTYSNHHVNSFSKITIPVKPIVISLVFIIFILSSIFLLTNKVFADNVQATSNLNVFITHDATIDFDENGKVKPVELTITNNEAQRVELSEVSISNTSDNQILWDVSLINNDTINVYRGLANLPAENIAFCVDPNSTKTVIINCKISDEEINKFYGKEIGILNFAVRPTNYNADYFNNGRLSQITPSRVNFDFDSGIFDRQDNTQYSKDLATLGLFSSVAVDSRSGSLDKPVEYQGCNVIVDGYDYDRIDALGFSKALGFKNPYYYDTFYPNQEMCADVLNPVLHPDTTKSYKDDHLAYTFAHKKLNIEGRLSEIILVSLQGTNDTIEEWSSNFDLGANTEDYYKIAGNDVEGLWTDKHNHKGYEVACNRAMQALQSYIDGNTDTSDAINKYIMFTGHSRGGGIANIMGSKFEVMKNADGTPKYKTFTYAFASSQTTDVSDANSYNTIFNICNTDDMVAQTLPDDSIFSRFGKDLKASVGANGHLTELFKKYSVTSKYSYNTPDKIKILSDAFYTLFEDQEKIYSREILYKPDLLNGVNFELEPLPSVQPYIFSSEAEANVFINELHVNYGILDKYCTFAAVKTHENEYKIQRTIVPAFMLQLAASSVIGQDLPFNPFCYFLNPNNKYGNLLLAFSACSNAMDDPHYTASYYAIIQGSDF